MLGVERGYGFLTFVLRNFYNFLDKTVTLWYNSIEAKWIVNGGRKMRRGFTLVELLVVILILSILISIATITFVGVISGSKEKACMMNMKNLYTYCMQYYTQQQDSFPFAGDGAEAYEHWQVLVNEVQVSLQVFKCPAMGNIKVAEPDPDTGEVTLEPQNVSYAYAMEQRTPDHHASLLAADKDFLRPDGGFGHPNKVITLKCDGGLQIVNVGEGETWDTVTKGQLVK